MIRFCLAAVFAFLALAALPARGLAGMPEVRGQLVDQGKPVQNGIVSIQGNSAITDQNGQFSLFVLPGPHPVIVTLRDRYGARYEGTIEIRDSPDPIVIDLAALSAVLDTKDADRWFVLIGTYANPSDAMADFKAALEVTRDPTGLGIYLAGRGNFALAAPAGSGEAEAARLAAAMQGVGLKQAAPYPTDLWAKPLVPASAAPDFDGAAIAPLIALLESEREEERRSARFALGGLGQQAVPQLVALAGRGNYLQDLGAIFALGQAPGWTAPAESVRQIWKVGRSYDDPAIAAALDQATQALAPAAKLAVLGFEGRDAVSAFQRSQKGLTPDGILGPATQRALNQALSENLR